MSVLNTKFNGGSSVTVSEISYLERGRRDKIASSSIEGGRIG